MGGDNHIDWIKSISWGGNQGFSWDFIQLCNNHVRTYDMALGVNLSRGQKVLGGIYLTYICGETLLKNLSCIIWDKVQQRTQPQLAADTFPRTFHIVRLRSLYGIHTEPWRGRCPNSHLNLLSTKLVLVSGLSCLQVTLQFLWHPHITWTSMFGDCYESTRVFR